MNENVNVGDRVRVTIEGVVTNVYPDGVSVNRTFVLTSKLPNAAVVVVEKAKKPVKVGDIIEGVKAFNDLPAGAVAVATHQHFGFERIVVRTPQGFFLPLDESNGNRRAGFYSEPRTIVYLPDAA